MGVLKQRCAEQRRALVLWNRIEETPKPQLWKGRMLIIVWPHDKRSGFDVKVDVFPREKAEWYTLCGWPGCPSSESSGLAPVAGPEPVVEATQPPQSETTKQGRGTKRAKILGGGGKGAVSRCHKQAREEGSSVRI